MKIIGFLIRKNVCPRFKGRRSSRPSVICAFSGDPLGPGILLYLLAIDFFLCTQFIFCLPFKWLANFRCIGHFKFIFFHKFPF
jgi:hypothetical protein